MTSSPSPYPSAPPPQLAPKQKRKVRIFTWIILAINLLFLIWIIAAVSSSGGNATDCGGLDQQTCNNAKDTGTAIGVAFVVFFWAAVDVILGIIWLITRKREPVIVYAAPPGGSWHPDPSDPRQLRWWDGQRFTEHTRPA